MMDGGSPGEPKWTWPVLRSSPAWIRVAGAPHPRLVQGHRQVAAEGFNGASFIRRWLGVAPPGRLPVHPRPWETLLAQSKVSLTLSSASLAIDFDRERLEILTRMSDVSCTRSRHLPIQPRAVSARWICRPLGQIGTTPST